MRSPTGLTLIELVVVLAVLAATSGVLVPLFTGTLQHANKVSTSHSLTVIRDAVHEYWRDTKHVPLDGVGTVATEADRLHIKWLFVSPVTGDATWDFSPNSKIGWRGPYLAAPTGDGDAPTSPSMVDAWNNDILIQCVDTSASLRDVRIVSGGPDGTINIPITTATSALTSANIGDDIYVVLSLR